jgi:hypothetical protein
MNETEKEASLVKYQADGIVSRGHDGEEPTLDEEDQKILDELVEEW